MMVVVGKVGESGESGVVTMMEEIDDDDGVENGN